MPDFAQLDHLGYFTMKSLIATLHALINTKQMKLAIFLNCSFLFTFILLLYDMAGIWPLL